jgi:hypothetical protein
MINALPGASAFWCNNPPTAEFQNVHNAADHTAVVYTRLAAHIGWQSSPSRQNCSSTARKNRESNTPDNEINFGSGA